MLFHGLTLYAYLIFPLSKEWNLLTGQRHLVRFQLDPIDTIWEFLISTMDVTWLLVMVSTSSNCIHMFRTLRGQFMQFFGRKVIYSIRYWKWNSNHWFMVWLSSLPLSWLNVDKNATRMLHQKLQHVLKNNTFLMKNDKTHYIN